VKTENIPSCVQVVMLCAYHSKGLADNSIVAKVNGVLWDLDRPLEEDCTVELLNFNDEEGSLLCVTCDSTIVNRTEGVMAFQCSHIG